MGSGEDRHKGFLAEEEAHDAHLHNQSMGRPGTTPKRWARVYVSLAEGDGLMALFVHPAKQFRGDRRWVSIDTTRRLQLVDLGSDRVFLKPVRGVEYNEFVGRTAAGRGRAVDEAEKISELPNPSMLESQQICSA